MDPVIKVYLKGWTSKALQHLPRQGEVLDFVTTIVVGRLRHGHDCRTLGKIDVVNSNEIDQAFFFMKVGAKGEDIYCIGLITGISDEQSNFP